MPFRLSVAGCDGAPLAYTVTACLGASRRATLSAQISIDPAAGSTAWPGCVTNPIFMWRPRPISPRSGLRRDDQSVGAEVLRDCVRMLEEAEPEISQLVARHAEIVPAPVHNIDPAPELTHQLGAREEHERLIDRLTHLREPKARHLHRQPPQPDEAEVVVGRDDDPSARPGDSDELGYRRPRARHVLDRVEADHEVEGVAGELERFDVADDSVCVLLVAQQAVGDFDRSRREVRGDDVCTSLGQVAGEASAPTADLQDMQALERRELFDRGLGPRRADSVLARAEAGVPTVVRLSGRGRAPLCARHRVRRHHRITTRAEVGRHLAPDGCDPDGAERRVGVMCHQDHGAAARLRLAGPMRDVCLERPRARFSLAAAPHLAAVASGAVAEITLTEAEQMANLHREIRVLLGEHRVVCRAGAVAELHLVVQRLRTVPGVEAEAAGGMPEPWLAPIRMTLPS